MSEMKTTTKAKRTYRLCPWVDRTTGETKYGIQVKLVGFDLRWMHCLEENTPLLFDDPDAAKDKMREMRKKDKEELAK